MRRWDIRRALGVPSVYAAFQKFARGRGDDVFVEAHLRPRPGDRVLDVGCGPGHLLDRLPDVGYLGFDMDARSIEAARKRCGQRGRFFCGKVSAAVIPPGERFDLVVASAVLHHLDDQEAGDLFEMAVNVLNPGGRLVSWDPCWVEGQSAFSRFLMARDRGRYVRNAEDYKRLASPYFKHVRSTVYHNLLRLPLPSVIMECRAEAPVDAAHAL
jgi:SAM-dependent methyltransferase